MLTPTNLFVALLVNLGHSGMPTKAVWQTSGDYPLYGLLATCVIATVFYGLLVKVFHRCSASAASAGSQAWDRMSHGRQVKMPIASPLRAAISLGGLTWLPDCGCSNLTTRVIASDCEELVASRPFDDPRAGTPPDIDPPPL